MSGVATTELIKGILPALYNTIRDVLGVLYKADTEGIREISREVGRMIHDEAMPSATPDGIRIGATLALFVVANQDTAPRT